METSCRRINAADLLLARGGPSRTALVCGEMATSYAELRIAVARAAGAWLDCGVERGEVVVLRGGEGIERAVAYLGAVWAGAVPVPLARAGHGIVGHPWDTHAPSRFILDDSRAGYAGSWRDSVVTLQEWRWYLEDAPLVEPVALRESAPACWTEPRAGDGSGARLLTHAFAALSEHDAGPSAKPVNTRVGTLLGMLRVMRRGGTALLAAPQGVTRLVPPPFELEPS